MPKLAKLSHKIRYKFGMEKEQKLPIDRKIEEANKKLKKAGTRVTIYRRENKLWLRGTLPPKPHINKDKDYPQFVSLGKNALATDKGVEYAMSKAKLLTGQLLTGTFNWGEWIDLEKIAPIRVEEKNIRDWCSEYEKDYWNRIRKTPEREYNWRKDYGLVLARLPQDEPLTLEALLEQIYATEPDSRTRKRVCTVYFKLAEFAALEGKEKIKELKGKYSASSVDPRLLPTDAEIAKFINGIQNPAWRWVVAMIATYGLRSHEVFRIDPALDEFPNVRVIKRSKTGTRIIPPLYPEWAAWWELQNICLPNINPDFANSKIGTKIGRWFLEQNVEFSSYDLRHCYARRCHEFNIAADEAAKFMGHSLSVHLSVYRRWFDESVYLSKYQRAISRSDRPSPPL